MKVLRKSNNLGSGGRIGNLVITTKIDVPKNLTTEEKKLVEELDKKLRKSSQTSSGFFGSGLGESRVVEESICYGFVFYWVCSP